MVISFRGVALGLALLTACGGGRFTASERGAGGQAGSNGSNAAGGRTGTGGTHDVNNGGAPIPQAGAPDGPPPVGGTGGALDDDEAGGQGGSVDGGGTCPQACGSGKECVSTAAGSECRCQGAWVSDGEKCRLPRSCDELHRYAPTLPSGPYALKPEGASSSFQAYCGMMLEGGGWTLVVNEGPGFDPTTAGVADALCYAARGTNIGYSLVPLNADVMLDISNSPIAGTTYTARLIVTGVHEMSRGKTLRTLFTTGPNYVEAENNSNLAVRMRDSAECNTLPADMAKLVCDKCSTADCKAPVLVFGDQDLNSGCYESGAPRFAIGGASDYTTAWENCAGWPQAEEDSTFYPAYVRVWLR